MSVPVTIAIARTGTFQAKNGHYYTLTSNALDAIAAGYDPARQEAPLVFGHPKDNEPAYGWVKRLFRNGEKLFAQFSQVPDNIRSAVRNGHYKYVSMALHPDGKRLRHVGLLGAVAPAIDGLGPVEMSGSDEFTINFAAADLETEARPLRDGPEAADQGVGMGPEEQKRLGALEEQLKSLSAQVDALTAAKEKAEAEAREAKEKAEKLEGEKRQAEQGAEEVKAEFSAYRGRQEKQARAARLDKLVADGKLTPGEKTAALAQAEALALIPREMEFSSGEKLLPEEQFWRSLEARGVSPLFTRFDAPPAEFSQGVASAPPLDLSKKI